MFSKRCEDRRNKYTFQLIATKDVELIEDVYISAHFVDSKETRLVEVEEAKNIAIGRLKHKFSDSVLVECNLKG